jgi:hypothetical protein
MGRFVQTSATIKVDLELSRYRTFPEDGMVELWGHVGDYEICVHLPLTDDRVRTLLATAEGPRPKVPRE